MTILHCYRVAIVSLFFLFPTTLLANTPYVVSPNIQAQDRYRQAFNPALIQTNKIETSRAYQKKYPIIQSDGYIEYELSGREFTTDPTLFETIRQDELFKQIPKTIQLGPPRLELRYLIQLDGQLADDLFISYYLFKEPDFPGQYSIEVQKGNNLLRFGQQNLGFKPVPFLQTKQSFEGVQFQSTQQNWNTTFAVGRARSKPQKYETFASNQTQFQLGNNFILEGSETVYINNQTVDPKDYILNYISGNLSFSRTLSPSDVIKVIYQFTNPVEDFIPSLSNKSILGHQFEWAPKDEVPTQKYLRLPASQSYRLDQDHRYWRRFYLDLPEDHHYLENVILRHQDQTLIENIDYRIQDQKIHFFHRSFEVNDLLSIEYDYVETELISEPLEIQSTQGPFYLLYGNIVPESLSVRYEEYDAQEYIDYIVDYKTGSLFFTYPIPSDADIMVDYRYLKEVVQDEAKPSSAWQVRSSYLENRSKSNDDTLQTQIETIQASQVSIVDGLQQIQLAQGAINTDKALQFSTEALANQVVSINAYKGQVFMAADATIPNGLVITYQHFQLFSAQYSFTGTGSSRYDSRQNGYTPPTLPIAFNGIYKIIISENGQELYVLNSENQDREFIVNYEDDGQYFTLDFLVGQQSLLTQLPQPNQTITVFYSYDSSTRENAFDDSHQVLDVGVSYSPIETWRLDAELAESRVNLRSNEISQSTQLVSDGRLTAYDLNANSLLIKQGSETVFVNGVSRRPFIHYTIDTINGRITFIEPIPVGTPILVSFTVIDEVQPIQQHARAFSLKNTLNSSQKGLWSVSNEFKTLAPEFVPIGQLNETPGETIVQNTMTWANSPRLNASVNHRSSLLNGSSVLSDRQLHHIDSTVSIPIYDIDSRHYVRLEKDQKEVVTTVPSSLDGLSTFNKESLGAKSSTLIEYSPRFKLGSSHRQINLYGTISKQDLQNHLDQNSEIRFYKIQSDIVYTVLNPWGVQSLQFRPLAGVSLENSSVFDDYTARKEGLIIGLGLNSTLMKGLTEDARIERNALTFTRNTTDIDDIIYNYHSHLNYVPFQWLQSHYKIDHTEDFGPVIGQEYLVHDQKDISLKRFNPRPILNRFDAPPFLIQSFNSAYFTGKHYTMYRRENNQLTLTDTTLKQVALYQVKLAPGLQLDRTHVSTTDREYLDLHQTSCQTFHNSSSNSLQWNAETTYEPTLPYLNVFRHKYSLRNTRLRSESLTDFTDRRTEIDTLIQENDSKHHISMTPQHLNLGPISFYQTTGSFLWHRQVQHDENTTESTNTSTFLDNFNLLERQVSVESSVFRRLDSSLSYTRHDDYYNRNKSSTTVGSLFKRQHQIDSEFTVSPWTSIDVGFGINTLYLSQFSDTDVYVPTDTLLNSSDTALFYRKKGGNLGLDYHMTQTIDLHVGSQLYFTEQEQTLPLINETFKEFTNDLGSTWSPLSGLKIRYDLRFHQLKNNQDNFDGESRKLTIIYNPIHYKNYNIDIKLTEEQHSGFGFNQIENDLSQQLSGTVLRQQIRERKDKVFKASLLLTIDIPLDSYRYLDTLKITGEGYFKTISDDFIDNNNYDISGFYLKASILL